MYSNSGYTISSPSYVQPNYTPLETIISGGYNTVSMDSIEQERLTTEDQRKNHYKQKFQTTKKYDMNSTKKQYNIFVPNVFLMPNRPQTEFVGEAKKIKEHIIDAFERTTGKPFPENILITIADEKTLAKKHEKWQKGIQGFSINKNGNGVSEVFVLHGKMDQVMLTMGHEIGHVISPTLSNTKDEEAKAYAFSLAWMRTIIKNDIAGLKHCINPNPAKNGLHDIAFQFVEQMLDAGKSAMQIFQALIEGTLSINRTIEQIILN